MSLERLRILHTIDSHGSVTAAAEALHVTTSAISQQMAKLERETGQQLLARNGRGVRLTDAGRLLTRHAERVLCQLELAHTELEAHRGQAVGELALAGFPTAARGLLPTALATLGQRCPQLSVHLREIEPAESVRLLSRGSLDLAVVLDWYNRPLSVPAGMRKAPLGDDHVDVAMPVTHRHARRGEVNLEDFAEDHWICWPSGEFCHEWLNFTLRAMGVEPKVAHRAAEHHTQLALVAAGLGVAVAPRLGRGVVPSGVAVVPVRHTMTRHVYALWREDADRRPSIKAAVEALRSAARSAGMVYGGVAA